MPKLTFVIGASASGKTYFIEHHFAQGSAEILDVYDYQQQAYDEAGYGESIPFGAQYRCLMRANQRLLDDMIEKLAQGRDVVVEQTFYKAKRRIAYVDEIRSRNIPDVSVEVYVMSPGEEQWDVNLKQRGLSSSTKEFAADIEFPNPAEGFDAVYEVTDGEIRLRMETPNPEIVSAARKELMEEAERIRKEDEEKQHRQELLESMNTRKFWHYCEVCGKKECLTAEEAYERGWDYPPKMGRFGLLSPRTCGSCGIKDTLWWKIQNNSKFPIVIEGELSPEELVVWRRIKGEPESLLEGEIEEQ